MNPTTYCPGPVAEKQNAIGWAEVAGAATPSGPHATLGMLLDELGAVHHRLQDLQDRLDSTVQRITGVSALVEASKPSNGPSQPVGQLPFAVDMAKALHTRVNRFEDAIMRLANLT